MSFEFGIAIVASKLVEREIRMDKDAEGIVSFTERTYLPSDNFTINSGHLVSTVSVLLMSKERRIDRRSSQECLRAAQLVKREPDEMLESEYLDVP
jgi:hypothetical protein